MQRLFAIDFDGCEARGVYRLERVYRQEDGMFLPDILAGLTGEIQAISAAEIPKLRQADAELAQNLAELENVRLAALAQNVASLKSALDLFLNGEANGGDIDRLAELVEAIAASRDSIDSLTSLKANQADLAALAGQVAALAGSETPKAHGTAAAGSSAKFAREDHVHPSNNTDTHWTSHLYAGTATGNVNAVTINGATYLILCDNSTVRNRVKLTGSGSVTVGSDASGNITISGTDTNTTYSDMTGASATANGGHGLVPAPAAGAANRYLRSDGTWQVPPDNNTTYGAATQSANGLMSAADKKKLDGIAAGAQVNPNMALYLALAGGTMTGRLTIQMAGNGLVFKNPDDVAASATTAQRWTYIEMLDKNSVRIASLVHGHATSGLTNTYIECKGQNNVMATLGVQVDASGVQSGYCPNPPASDSSNKIATTSWSIPKAQNRGTPAGYETVQALSNSQTININSADCINLATSGAVTLTFTAGAATQRAIKVLCLTASAATTLTVKNAVWANNGAAPAWGNAGKILVLVAHFVGGRVVLSVIDNTQ